jgi:hypothetical protein
MEIVRVHSSGTCDRKWFPNYVEIGLLPRGKTGLHDDPFSQMLQSAWQEVSLGIAG